MDRRGKHLHEFHGLHVSESLPVQSFSHRLAVDEFQDQVGHAIPLAHVVQPHDVGVLQLGVGLGLILIAPGGVGAPPDCRKRESKGDNATVEPSLPCTVDDGRPPSPTSDSISMPGIWGSTPYQTPIPTAIAPECGCKNS